MYTIKGVLVAAIVVTLVACGITLRQMQTLRTQVGALSHYHDRVGQLEDEVSLLHIRLESLEVRQFDPAMSDDAKTADSSRREEIEAPIRDRAENGSGRAIALIASAAGNASGEQTRKLDQAAASLYVELLLSVSPMQEAATLVRFQTASRGDHASDIYLRGYLDLQHAEKLSKAGSIDEAMAKYLWARCVFDAVRHLHPSWNEKMVDFRIRKIDEVILTTVMSEA